MAEHNTLEQLSAEYERLSAEIDKADDQGVTVTPEQRQRLTGLYKLIQAKRHNEGGSNAGSDL